VTINKDGTVSIDVSEYISEILNDFPEEIKAVTTSPAGAGLFIVPHDDKLLDEGTADYLHSIVAKLQWLMKRGRPDVEVPVSFLSTRVKQPGWSDWVKLRRVLGFLKHTINDVRRIGIHNVGELITMVDASYAVHPNMRGHTGGLLTMGKGVLHTKSSKQKINTKSSTESELVGVSEYLPYSIWMTNFLEAQGYKVKKNVLYQDNMSAMRMEKNGRNSCTGNSRHIHIRYFFVKDRVDKGEVEIHYCPTNRMVADFYTKPLQGKLFHKLRRFIMGWCTLDELYDDLGTSTQTIDNSGGIGSSDMKECVGEPDESPSSHTTKPNVRSDIQRDSTNKNKKVSWADIVRGSKHNVNTNENRNSH